MAENRVFAYIIATVNSRYGLTGCVPCVQDGKVFLGPCKKLMRPAVKEGDYVMGISGSAAGTRETPRRILLWMRVKERMTFNQAWKRGDTDETFRSLRGWAIHVRPRPDADNLPSPDCYEHIPGAPHKTDWRTDVEGDRDAFLLGDSDAWVASENGPEVTPELVEWIKTGITWVGDATPKNPLTQNAIGKHALLTGQVAGNVINWMPKLETIFQTERWKHGCGCDKKCECE